MTNYPLCEEEGRLRGTHYRTILSRLRWKSREQVTRGISSQWTTFKGGNGRGSTRDLTNDDIHSEDEKRQERVGRTLSRYHRTITGAPPFVGLSTEKTENRAGNGRTEKNVAIVPTMTIILRGRASINDEIWGRGRMSSSIFTH